MSLDNYSAGVSLETKHDKSNKCQWTGLDSLKMQRWSSKCFNPRPSLCTPPYWFGCWFNQIVPDGWLQSIKPPARTRFTCLGRKSCETISGSAFFGLGFASEWAQEMWRHVKTIEKLSDPKFEIWFVLDMCSVENHWWWELVLGINPLTPEVCF